MALSTNSVFHFTDSLEKLKGIVKNKFNIKYCVEKLQFDKEPVLEFATPMVSFCDIPLSQVSAHINKYGGYGIGLSKTWAKKNGINPVLYLERNSKVTQEIISSCKTKDIIRFTKDYEGELVRNNQTVQKLYRFYDEREWRYCPMISEENSFENIIDATDYRNDKEKYNNTINHLKLPFGLNYITYLFVREPDEIKDVINFFESNLESYNERKYIPLISATLITVRQLKSDF